MTLDEIKARCHEIGECWEWASKARSAARRIHPQMRTERGGPPKLVRRVAYELMYGELPDKRYPVPQCGCAFCVNPAHQWVLTQAQKNRRTGKMAANSQTRSASISMAWRNSGRTAMTVERANEIREAEGTLKELAQRFGMSPSMIGAIRRGEYWRDYSSPFTGMFAQLVASNESNARRTA
jgi:hypothetical protein